MICAKLKPAVSGLEREFSGVRAKNEDATSAEGKAAIQELGFQSHGIVIRSAGAKSSRVHHDRIAPGPSAIVASESFT